jgi:hypothetical protein
MASLVERREEEDICAASGELALASGDEKSDAPTTRPRKNVVASLAEESMRDDCGTGSGGGAK